jgi:hypothetical protein
MSRKPRAAVFGGPKKPNWCRRGGGTYFGERTGNSETAEGSRERLFRRELEGTAGTYPVDTPAGTALKNGSTYPSEVVPDSYFGLRILAKIFGSPFQFVDELFAMLLEAFN